VSTRLRIESPGVGRLLWQAVAPVLFRIRNAFRERPGRTIEVAVGASFAFALVTYHSTRMMIRVWSTIAFQAGIALIPLLRVDGAATAWALSLWLGRMGLALAPAALLIRSSPRHRWIWLIPFVGMFCIVGSAFALTACATIEGWLRLACVSGVTAALTRVRFLRWSALLPLLLLFEVVPRHSLGNMRTSNAAYRERLLAECAHHDGVRPRNLTADRVMPYFGITSVRDDLVLLTGQGPEDDDMWGWSGGRRVGSWWLRRKDGGFEFDAPSEASTKLWRGCLLGDTVWMARAQYVLGARRLPEDAPAPETVSRLQFPSGEIDSGEVACDPDRGRLYVSEATKGGLWELVPDTGESRRHEIGGVGLVPKRRSDGRLVLTRVQSLMVFDPGQNRVVERVPAGLVIMGFDVCAVDGSVAAPDSSGRLRVFEIDGNGHYRFAWGVSLFAPRRAAFSRDCSRIAVTSFDDRHVFIVDAASHRVVEALNTGPALREVTATGPREFSFADSCSINTYSW